jgi:DNA-binding IclR family transcriptional regulator
MAGSYTHEGQQRVLRLVMLLAGHEITGVAPADIAKQQGCNASAVTRDLDNLREAGFAEQVPETGRWRLAPQVVQIAIRHMAALDRAQARLDETRNRFSRS